MKKIVACLIAAVIILGIGTLPQQIVGSLDKLAVVTPQPYTYQPEIDGNGIVIVSQGVKVLVSGNVIVKELLTPNGSWVNTGEVLAITEPPTSEQAFLHQSIDSPSSSFSPAELESLASQYGFELPKSALAIDANALLESVNESRQAVAPISGIITWSSASAGQFLPAGSQLCTILGVDSYKAVIQVSADKAESIVPGSAAKITGGEIDNRTFAGSVTSVGNTISHNVSATGYSSTVDIEVSLDTTPDTIRHGANVSCTIYTGEPQQLLTIPYEAVQQDEKNREFVYCVYGNSLRKQYIKTGIELADRIEVVSGVGYDNVVVAGEVKGADINFMLESE